MWNAPIFESILYTALIGAGASCVSVLIGCLLAVAFCYYRVPGWRIMEGCLLSLVLVPVYVQAVAWSSGFGVQGWLGVWFKFSQVAAALSRTSGVMAVIWIHGCALVPISYLINRLGLDRLMDHRTRQAWVDFGPGQTLVRFVLPRMVPWVVASLFASFAFTTNDMVVTNLFQVPSLTESLYQQVQFDELRWAVLATSSLFAFGIGIAIAIGFEALQNSLGNDSIRTTSDLRKQAVGPTNLWLWCGGLGSGLLVALVQGVPLCNLIMRTGWQSTMQGDRPIRCWNILSFVESLWEVRGFSSELLISLQLCMYSMLLSLVVGALLVSISSHRYMRMAILFLLGTSIAMPGPVVNYLVQRWNQLIVELSPDVGRSLADQSLLGPILALQFRCVPIFFALLLISVKRFQNRSRQVLILDRSLPLKIRFWIYGRALWVPALAAAVISFFVAFGDLSTYLLVLPPGVTPVALRMFELLHYGVKNQDAALALTLSLATVVVTNLVRFRA